MHTRSFDVVDQQPEGLAESSVGYSWGVTERTINAETQAATFSQAQLLTRNPM
jgi:hypothetical protein